MPPGTRVGHIHLHVGDLDRAATFYHHGLGFDRIILDLPGALFMSAGGYHHHLGTNTWAAGAPLAGEGDARLLEWTLRVSSPAEVQGAGTSMRASGHAVRFDSADLVVADPWGTSLRITAT
jgi:catechol 2,3-dioxygenase